MMLFRFSIVFGFVMSLGGLCLAAEVPIDHDPAKATSYLDVAGGLEVTLFCSEPRMTNPTNIDIDPLGRVWVCDVQNYRGHNGLRPAGDRILVMQDTTGSGRADRVTTFYQGRDVDSAMGVCVLGDKVIVSCSPTIWQFTIGSDGRMAEKKPLFTNTGIAQHDHGAHKFVFGPDGEVYWNFGNEGHSVHDAAGRPVVDLDGNVAAEGGRPYRDGMVFRCQPDGSQFETLAYNFRNAYEVCVDSFGTMWQSDNDDDGNRGCRILYVMQHGNYGYKDEMTGASWAQYYLGQPQEIPLRHWHLTDPGVVPNLLQTGAGAPAGMTINEGELLPNEFRNQMIHTDPLLNIVRSYPAERDGAGYKARVVDILSGARNRWFRPVDVSIAPDGSLFVADWYDPGVGGHAQQDTDRGRIFRIAPKGSKYVVPKFDFTTIDGAIEALKNPCLSVRYMAWTRLHAAGAAAEPALERLYRSDNPRYRARALWLLSKIHGRGAKHIETAIADSNPDIRITALRAAKELESISSPVAQGGQSPFRSEDPAKWGQTPGEYSGVATASMLKFVAQLVHDPSPQVRRECALSLRHIRSPRAAELWAELAAQHDGHDRWYLEALGIGADGQWNAFFAAWQKRVGPDWNAPSGRDIVWRSRAEAAMPLLARMILDPATTPSDRVRYFRAFDFHTEPSKQAILIDLLGGHHPQQATINSLALEQLHGVVPDTPEVRAVINETLDRCRGTEQFVDLVRALHRTDRGADLLAIALEHSQSTLGVRAAVQMLQTGSQALFNRPLAADDTTAINAITVLGLSQEPRAIGLVEPVMLDSRRSQAVRIAAVEALGRSHLGEMALLTIASKGGVPVEIQYTLGKVLANSADNHIRATAAKFIKLPDAAGGRHLPPLSELAKRRGNAARGKIVFETVGTCVKCHTVNHVGKDVGPNLSEIGNKATRDFLYESILFPSAAIAHNYETWRLELENGNVVSGIVVSETKDAISVKTADAIVRTYKPSEIETRIQLKTSLMPADLQKLMTTDDLVNVVEYLTTLKKAK